MQQIINIWNITPNLHTNSHFEMWAKKWTIMQEASGSSTAPNAARRKCTLPLARHNFHSVSRLNICTWSWYILFIFIQVDLQHLVPIWFLWDKWTNFVHADATMDVFARRMSVHRVSCKKFFLLYLLFVFNKYQTKGFWQTPDTLSFEAVPKETSVIWKENIIKRNRWVHDYVMT